ncbi:LacI family transcriptional regulator [Rathayibacter sp. AY2B7]|nr:LacI family transcriptional regulator [Rathayibacter sp. AY2B7]
MANRVTSRDVATAAGVAQSTVSFVLNDSPGQSISADTRERVLRAARELQYTPNHAGRALRRGRSDIVLLLLPTSPLGSLSADMITFVTDEFERVGFAVLTRRVPEGKPISSIWRGLSPTLVIGFAKVSDAEVEEMRQAGIASFMPDSQASSQEVGRVQARHLIDAGHRTIGYLWPSDPRQRGYAVDRLGGVQHECEESGLDAPRVVEIDFDVESATTAIAELRAAEPRVTAVCVYNDEYAFAVLAAMDGLGLRVPADMAVIGVDNIQLAAFAHPPLTTVDIGLHGVLAQIARITTDEFSRPGRVIEVEETPVTLVPRASV